MKGFARICSFIIGLLMVAMGIQVFVTPVASLIGLALFMSAAVFIYGIYEIYLYFSKNETSGWILASGILSCLLGLWLLFSQGTTGALVVALPFIFAFWILIAGINRIIGSFALKDIGVPRWGWILTVGILGVLFGFSLLFSPVVSALTLSIALGCVFIWQGVSAVCLAFAKR